MLKMIMDELYNDHSMDSDDTFSFMMWNRNHHDFFLIGSEKNS